MKFIAGYNMAGYLPENDPDEFNTFDEAKRCLISAIKKLFEDNAENERQAENFAALAEDVNLWNSPQGVCCEGWEFWIHKEN